MIDLKGKAWGRTAEIFRAPHSQAHLLEIDPGGFCSEHRHARKANTFFVIHGKLEILVWPAMNQAPDRTILAPFESTTVPPGVWHQFRAIEPTLAVEFYAAAEIEEDIERRTTGGSGPEDPEWPGLP